MQIMKFAVMASLVVSSAAFAQAAPEVAAPAPVKEKKICRSEVPLGSIMAKRVCMTKSQWAETHAKNGAAAEKGLGSVRDRANAGLSAAQ